MFYGFLLPRGPRAERPRRRSAPSTTHTGRDESARRFTMRLAEASDAPELERLAALDCAKLPGGELLVGEMGGGIQAAVPVYGGSAIANPFVRTAELVSLLETRAGQLRDEADADARVAPMPRRHTLTAA